MSETKKDFPSYYAKLELDDAQKKKTGDHIRFVEKNINEIEDVFISEQLDASGKRKRYNDLLLFTSEEVFIVKDFLKTDEYISTHLKKEINLWKLRPVNYEVGNSTQDSWLVLEIETIHGFKLELKASGKNCDTLWGIFKSYVLKQKSSVRAW